MDCLMPELITSWALHLMPNHIKKKSINMEDPEVLKIICSKMLLKKILCGLMEYHKVYSWFQHYIEFYSAINVTCSSYNTIYHILDANGFAQFKSHHGPFTWCQTMFIKRKSINVEDSRVLKIIWKKMLC